MKWNPTRRETLIKHHEKLVDLEPTIKSIAWDLVKATKKNDEDIVAALDAMTLVSIKAKQGKPQHQPKEKAVSLHDIYYSPEYHWVKGNVYNTNSNKKAESEEQAYESKATSDYE